MIDVAACFFGCSNYAIRAPFGAAIEEPRRAARITCFCRIRDEVVTVGRHFPDRYRISGMVQKSQ